MFFIFVLGERIQNKYILINNESVQLFLKRTTFTMIKAFAFTFVVILL